MGGLEAKYGLPEEVLYCKRCVISNQRPSSTPEFRNTIGRQIRTIAFDSEGVCDACRYTDHKRDIDWDARESELVRLLDAHRSPDGRHDCIVAGSGGKDSSYASHVLKARYGMNPLTVTWPPHIYTEIGWRNFKRWLDVGGFDNVTYSPNGGVHRLLTRLAIENLLHPFQPFILGQKNMPAKMALLYRIPLVFYGENEAEYGNPIRDNDSAKRDASFYSASRGESSTLAGVSLRDLREHHGLRRGDIEPYLPADPAALAREGVQVHYMGYYLRWTPQEAYYYAVENCGFEANPVRTEGTYSKYASLDDRIDGLHYYTTWIKFGIGRATYDAAQEVRNRHITREEGVALVHRYDGEFPERHFDEIMDYVGLDRERFIALCDAFRSPHLWSQEGGRWSLRSPLR